MEDLLIALRAVVALGAVLALLVFLSRRVQRSQAKGTSPLSELVPRRLVSFVTRSPRRGATGSRSRQRPERITVVARSGLGGKAQLVVAEFGGIRYVLGVTEHGINVVDTQEAVPIDEPSEMRDDHDDPPASADGRALKPVA